MPFSGVAPRAFPCLELTPMPYSFRFAYAEWGSAQSAHLPHAPAVAATSPCDMLLQSPALRRLAC